MQVLWGVMKLLNREKSLKGCTNQDGRTLQEIVQHSETQSTSNMHAIIFYNTNYTLLPQN